MIVQLTLARTSFTVIIMYSFQLC